MVLRPRLTVGGRIKQSGCLVSGGGAICLLPFPMDQDGRFNRGEHLGQVVSLSRDVGKLIHQAGDPTAGLLLAHGLNRSLEVSDAIPVPLTRCTLSASVEFPLLCTA